MPLSRSVYSIVDDLYASIMMVTLSKYYSCISMAVELPSDVSNVDVSMRVAKLPGFVHFLEAVSFCLRVKLKSEL